MSPDPRGKNMKIRNSIFLTSAAVAALVSVPAMAQEDVNQAPEDAVDEAEPDDKPVIGGIVVTGTRIRRPNLEATEPTTSIDSEYLE